MSVLPLSARRSAVRPSRLATAVATIGIAVALGTTGCGAGQISQTANQLPAVNGANVNIDSLQLRDVQIVYPEKDAPTVFGNGGPFEIAFVVANSDPTVYYRLKEIKPEKGSIEFVEGSDSADRVIPPGQALRGGTPVGATRDGEKKVTAELTNAGDTVASGLTTELTFVFEKRESNGSWVPAGETTVQTPVDAGAKLERQDVARNAEPTFYNQGHGEGGHGEGEGGAPETGNEEGGGH
ncbi:hypothetical protein GOAMI_14_00320 [Gordonia amicalis NBRC 100051 = JCM 11271]|nr:hypothetical protein GOAMI_14_00320 [Gordonia amicalis NBRC 100051 = JCM 11271]